MAHLYRRTPTGPYYARIRRPDGTWTATSTRCTDRRAAERVAAELERRAADPAAYQPPPASTASVLDDFLTSRRDRGRAAGTLHHYRVKLGHLLRLLPPVVSDVRFAAIERYRAQRLAEGAHATTVEKELRALSAALRYAQRAGTYPHDPRREMPEIGDSYRPRERALSLHEVHLLLEALAPHRAAHVAFIVATGARRGEAERARRGDAHGGMVRLRGTKTALAPRTVPVVAPFDALLEYALQHAGGAAPLLLGTWSSICQDLRRACARAGIRTATPNDLRRTPATLLRAAGAPLDVVAAFLGHSTSRMVERVYGRLSPEQLRDRLEAAVSPAAVSRVTHLRHGKAEQVREPGSAEDGIRAVLPRKRGTS